MAIPREHVALLTARETQAAVLRDLNWTHRQIAVHLNVTESTVRATLDRAARKIATATAKATT